MQAITMFTSYGFAATNARLIPFFQRKDADAIKAELTMLTLGAFVGPIRDYLDGREVDLSNQALLGSAITNTGFLGWPLDLFNRMNALVDIPYLNALKNNRYGLRGVGSLLLGAPGGVADAFVGILNDLATGKITQGTAKNLVRSTIFGASAWYARPLVNWSIEQTGLPKTRREAKEWFPDSRKWVDNLFEDRNWVESLLDD